MNNPKDKKILIVDDEKYIGEIVAFDLERKGYQTALACSGDEAFVMVKNQQFDLVISDVRMPSGTGVDLLKNIKNYNALEPRFIFMTAFADISSDEALDQGAEAFLVKPIVQENLFEEVERALLPRAERWSQLPANIECLSPMKIEFSEKISASAPFVDVGYGGIFCQVESVFPDNQSIVALDIMVQHQPLFKIEGYAQTRWVRREGSAGIPAGLGLEILYLSDESRRQYLEYISERKPIAFIPLGLTKGKVN